MGYEGPWYAARTVLEILICLTALEMDSAGDIDMPVSLQEPDMIIMCKYGDVDLDEDPVVVLPCGHLLTMQSMDGHMELAKAYTLTESGETIYAGAMIMDDSFTVYAAFPQPALCMLITPS